MRNLSTQEVQAVSGGGGIELAVGIIIAVATAAYDMGKTLASNDNKDGITCKGTPVTIQ
jgi:hypothetical protein